LCSSLSADKKVHYEQKAVGHYGVFNGSRFRAEIMPRVSDFMRSAAGAPKLHVVSGSRDR
jgi:poly(3-hydroxybutyrate) depolymerase